MTAQPAWQLPMTQGLPSAWGCNSETFFRNTASARAISSMVWPGHGLRQETDKITRVTGFKSDADLAVGLEAANTGAVSGARIDDDKRPARRIDLDTGRRDNADKTIVDRLVELAAVGNEFHLVIEHMRGCLRQMLAILIAALPHHIPEQDVPLRGVDEIFDRWSNNTSNSGATPFVDDFRRLGDPGIALDPSGFPNASCEGTSKTPPC